MSELGDVLRKARIEKGLSLEDIQEVTKIRKRYLEALEAGDYNVLPGKFYIRAFIKNYAEVVGLDSEEVLLFYKDEVPEPEIPISENIPSRKPKRMRSATSEKFGKVGFTILMWSFFILIAFVIYYFYLDGYNKPADKIDDTNMTDNSDTSTVTQKPDSSVAPATPTPTVTPTIAPLTLTAQESTGREDVFAISPAKASYTLELTATGGASWIEVYDGVNRANRLHYTSMNDGDKASYEVSEEVYLVIRHAGYIEATIDGIVIEDGDNNKASKRIILKPVTEGGAATVE